MSTVPLMSLHSRAPENIRDTDQFTDEDEDPLESVLNRMKYRAQLSRARNSWAGLTIAGLLFFIVGFCIGYVTFFMLDKNIRPLARYINGDTLMASAILNEIRGDSIAEFVRSLNNPNSTNTTSTSLKHAQAIQQHFREENLDSVSPIFPSRMFLSFFDDDVNTISVHFQEGEIIYRSKALHYGVPKNITKFEVSNITMGSAVFVNFGTDSDFHFLKTRQISVKNMIVLARLGKVLPVDLVDTAFKRGVKGVVLITDEYEPQTKDGSEEGDGLYNSSLSPSQLGMLQVMHGNPSLQSNTGVENMRGCLPILVISSAVAQQVIGHIFMDYMAMHWKKNLTSFYPLDYDFPRRLLKLDVHIVNTEKTFYNVIATMQGSQEPDRYILVANNRELLVPGGLDPMGGAASMMELVRVLAKLRRNNGWSPRRTLVFCSWGVSQGDHHLTTTPLAEEWGHFLENQALGYISIEAAVTNTSFNAQVTPLLTKALFDSAALVPNPNREEVVKGIRTLHDSWLNASKDDNDKPFVDILRGYGDLRTIIHNHGIPSLSFQFGNLETDSKRGKSQMFKDENFTYHRASTQLLGVLVWKMSDTVIVPLDVLQYSSLLNHSLEVIENKYKNTILNHSIPMDDFADAVLNFKNASLELHTKLSRVNQLQSLEVRIFNDKLLRVERSFLHHKAIDKTNTAFRHVVLAPGKYLDHDPSTGFQILQDLLSDLTAYPDLISKREDILNHIEILKHCVTSTSKVLSDSLLSEYLADL